MVNQFCVLLAIVGLAKAPPLPPDKAFEIKLPEGKNWETLLKGPYQGVEGTYCISVADRERTFQLSVIVFPATERPPTREETEKGLEKGFVKKASRKKSAEHVTISGQRGYKVVAEIDQEDGTSVELVGVFFVTDAYNFMLGVTKPGKDVADLPEAKAFLNSFKILKSPPSSK